ncbi:hypothetical protein HDC90_004130 [Pedobacter sp. AK013]|nr:hypothetical protein [Pedobacter sp. AK013]
MEEVGTYLRYGFSLIKSSLREGFSADEAIFIATVTGKKDCFVPRNDDIY